MGRKVVSIVSQLHPLERWTARRNGCGVWVITDEAGNQPLRHIELAERIKNVHLAAAAPDLRHELDRLLHRFRSICESHGIAHEKWNTRYMQSAFSALMGSRPVYAEINTRIGGASQAEIDWPEAA